MVVGFQFQEIGTVNLIMNIILLAIRITIINS